MFDVPYDSIGELKTIFKKAKFIHSYSTGFLTQQHARSSDCCFWHSSNIKTNFTIQWILDYFVNSEIQFSMIMIFASPNKHDINVQQTFAHPVEPTENAITYYCCASKRTRRSELIYSAIWVLQHSVRHQINFRVELSAQWKVKRVKLKGYCTQYSNYTGSSASATIKERKHRRKWHLRINIIQARRYMQTFQAMQALYNS